LRFGAMRFGVGIFGIVMRFEHGNSLSGPKIGDRHWVRECKGRVSVWRKGKNVFRRCVNVSFYIFRRG
jgi:hypothetical protein